MNISELIIRLRELQLEYGDLPVSVYSEWYSFQVPVTDVRFVDGDWIGKLLGEIFPRAVYQKSRILIR